MARKKRTKKQEIDWEEDDEWEEEDEECEPSSGNFLTRMLFQPRLLVWMAICASAITFYPKLKSLLPDLRQRNEYRLEQSDIVITPAPHWVPDDLIEQVIKRVSLPNRLSLLDENLVEELAEGFAAHPWIAEVSQVRLASSGVEVDLAYRRPIAMVQVKQGMYPIDAYGILLPPRDFSIEDTKRFPIIRNIQSTPQGPAGTSWGDVCVLGAARLAEAVGPYWKQFNLVAIDAPVRMSSNTTMKDMIFELSTSGGSQIVWGRAPDSDHPGELTGDQKIGRLQEYQEKYGRFDQPHGPYRIEIYHWREISRRPLSARKGSPAAR